MAHFYNTIDQQMIPSQQAMMLDSALAFERLIKNPKAGESCILSVLSVTFSHFVKYHLGSKQKGNDVLVTWDNPEELEAYIVKLQSAAERLTSENRRLRKCHQDITDKVVQLMSVDLLRQQAKWKEILMDIRHIMASLNQQGFSASNMKPWKAHWDRQLYKALEHQYQMGLEALNENLPEIQVELVYR